MAEIDFEAEGLLEGVDGEAREARRELLHDLAGAGVPLDQLRRAVEEDRLALLPVELVLGGEARYTPREVAELAGVEIEALVRQQQAAGLPVPGPDEPALTELDLEAARRMKAFRDAGITEEGILEVSRVIGMSMSQVAAAIRRLIGESFIHPGDTERDVALRFAAAGEALNPMLGATLEYVFTRHLREQVRQDVIGRAEIEAGELAGSAEVTVAFADLVGFTDLGEQLDAEAIGELGGRVGELASERGAISRAAGEADRRRGNACLSGRRGTARGGPLAGRGRPGGRGNAAAARRGRERGGAGARRRLVRAPGQPGGAGDRGGQAGQRARHRPGQGAGGRGAFSWSYAGERHLRGIKGDVRLFRARRRTMEG